MWALAKMMIMGGDDILPESPVMRKQKETPALKLGKDIATALKSAASTLKLNLDPAVFNDVQTFCTSAKSKNLSLGDFSFITLPKNALSKLKAEFQKELAKMNLDTSFANLVKLEVKPVKTEVKGKEVFVPALVFTYKPVEAKTLDAKGPEQKPLPSAKGMKDPVQVFSIALEAGAREAGMPLAKKEWSDEFINIAETFKEYIQAKKDGDLHAGAQWNFPILLEGDKAKAFVKAFNSKIAESGLFYDKDMKKNLVAAILLPAGKKPFARFKAVVTLSRLFKTVFSDKG